MERTHGVPPKTDWTSQAAAAGSPPQRACLKDFHAPVRKIRRSLLLFVVSVFGYLRWTLPLLSADPDIGPFVFVLSSVLLSLALRLQRAGLNTGPTGKVDTLQAITPAGYRRQLAQLKERIGLAEFSLKKAPFQAGALAWTALLMTFAPSYPVIRWLNGSPLPAEAGWMGITFRFLILSILFSWFLRIWSDSKLTADAIQDEINAIDNSDGSQ